MCWYVVSYMLYVVLYVCWYAGSEFFWLIFQGLCQCMPGFQGSYVYKRSAVHFP